MDTKVWGPPGWIFLHTITFNYPKRIDDDNKEHVQKRTYTRELLENLQYTLPCKYCRKSFKKFLRELPIEDYLGGRDRLSWWLYAIHNKVNAKLRAQESEAVDHQYRKVAAAVHAGTMSYRQAKDELRAFVQRTMITEEDPSFEEICARYESFRAGCHADAGEVPSCRAPPK
jgi:hypothetical protein